MDRRQLDAYLERVAAETAEWVKAHPIRDGEAELEEFREPPACPNRASGRIRPRKSTKN